ncbi:MAG: glycosyl hydrolase family 8 [Candidatus Margulisiibacteriota bacterium]
MKTIVIFMVLTGFLFANVDQMLAQSWNHYKKQKIDLSGRPLADIDKTNLSFGSYGKALTFSESISYVLFRAALSNDRETFERVWLWASRNMLRKNMTRVFNWEESRWTPIPEGQRNYLFAWRYTPNIKNTNMGGVIYVPDSSMASSGWRNGLDVAPDGDQLIAAALIMAHNRWGSVDGELNFLFYAKHIAQDIWKECVMARTPGMLETFETSASADKWFTYGDESGQVVKHLEVSEGNRFLSIKSTRSSWFGVGKYLGSIDLMKAERISFRTCQNSGVRMIFEDNEGKKVTLEKRYPYSSLLEEVSVSLPKNGNGLDWSHVKNIMFQPIEDKFTLDDVRVRVSNESMSQKTYYLLANDRGDPWINPSYYMPFLYRVFADLDEEHPWLLLYESALALLLDSKTITLSNNKGELFHGNGALFPDWCMLDLDNRLTDLPWAKDGTVDGYLYGWDAFRSFYFLGLTSAMYPEKRVTSLLRDQSYEFFRSKLFGEDKLIGGYAIDGRTIPIRGTQQEYPSTYGVYLAYFTALDDHVSAEAVFRKLEKMYNRKGYWGEDSSDYYKQNWAWLGLDFYQNKGVNISALLQIPKRVASFSMMPTTIY